jgi:hypothetical protein
VTPSVSRRSGGLPPLFRSMRLGTKLTLECPPIILGEFL